MQKKYWQGRFQLEGFGTWPFIESYHKMGFSTWYSWEVNPSFPEGFPDLDSSHALVLRLHVETLLSGLTWSQNFLACVCFSSTVCSFVLLFLKTPQYFGIESNQFNLILWLRRNHYRSGKLWEFMNNQRNLRWFW